jgi:signal transduction histidine kinase
MWAETAARKGLTLIRENKTNVSDVQVLAESGSLIRIIGHLLDNAIKFTSDGSVTLRMIDGLTAESVGVQVCDTGVGIDAAFLPHLFEPFKQHSTGFGRSHEGNGLGLAVVGGLADAMGMQLTVESEPNNGTCITLYMPLCEVIGYHTSDRIDEKLHQATLLQAT